MNEVAAIRGPAGPFASMPEMQREHLALVEADDALERAVEESRTGGVEAFRDIILLRRRVRHFERRTAATGTILDDAADRALATSMLDFWGIRQAYLRRYTDQFRPLKPNRENLPFATPRPGGSMTLAPFDQASAPELPDNPSPFVGLNAFGEREASASIFRGREDAVAELRNLLEKQRLVIVTGPSGSGKSSLVMAGLVPALHAGAIPGSSDWRYPPPIMPGADPFASFVQAFDHGAEDTVGWIAAGRAALEQNPDKVDGLIKEGGEKPALVIVDQMEEVLSMVADKAVQEKFAAAVVAPSRVAAPEHRVIVIIREDFLGRMLKLAAFQSVPDLQVAEFRPKPMTSAELRQAIEEPARAVGLKFDDGIVDDLVREVINDPAALPLLQFTLAQLWRCRRRNRITRQVYDEIGRPADALGRTAERLYKDQKTEQNQAAVRDIFLALVVPSVGAEYVRRRVRRETLHGLRDSTQIDRVLEAFVSAGLIRKTPGMELGDDRFDVMHEALLRNWSRLAAWLKEVRDQEARKLLVLNRARIWFESGREPDHLAVGAAITETAEFEAADPLILEYVNASRAWERATQRRSKIRKLIVAAAIVALIVVGVGTNLWGWLSSQTIAKLSESRAIALNQILAQAAPPQSGVIEEQRVRIADEQGMTGLVRIGLADQSFLRAVGGQSQVAPADVRPGAPYRLIIDTPVVSFPMPGDPPGGQVRMLGYVSGGALVVARGGPTTAHRQTDQYWLPVRVVPRVRVLFSGGTAAEANRVLQALRDHGFDAQGADTDANANGLAAVRYYVPEDRPAAEALAALLNLPATRNLEHRRRVAAQNMKSDGQRVHYGRLEVVLDLAPEPAVPAAPAPR